MISRLNFFLIALCIVSGAGVFELKHSVAAMRDQLKRVEADIDDERRQIRMLGADWAHVTRPDRLAELAAEIGMVRAGVQHVVKLDRLGRRSSLEMARHSFKIRLSEEKEGILRARPHMGLTMTREDWR